VSDPDLRREEAERAGSTHELLAHQRLVPRAGGCELLGGRVCALVLEDPHASDDALHEASGCVDGADRRRDLVLGPLVDVGVK